MIDFGMTPRAFREHHFERAPCLRRGSFTSTFGWADLDALLGAIEPVDPAFQMFRDGPLAPDAYSQLVRTGSHSRRRLIKSDFYRQMSSGASLVLNRLEDSWPAARRLCREVGRFAAQPASGNAYVSFGGGGSFGRHWDTHDVFVLQLIGRKHWQVWEPTFPLPLAQHTSQHADALTRTAPTSRLVIDQVLEPGDLLYLPRGWWHQVTPLAEGSLHLSVGTYAPTVVDYLQWVATQVLPRDAVARQAIETADADDLAEVLRVLSAAVRNPMLAAEFQRDQAARERAQCEFDTELFLQRGPAGIADDTRLRLCSCLPLRWEAGMLRIDSGGVLPVDELGVAILRLLSAWPATLRFDELLGALRNPDRDAVAELLLQLSLHEVVAIER